MFYNDGIAVLHPSLAGAVAAIGAPHELVPTKAGPLLCVRWSLRVAQALSKAGHVVPSPIVSDYKWPGRFPPMRHQEVTAAFLTLHPRAFLLNDPGTGKTASVIWAYDYLRSIGAAKRLLVTAPLSCVRSVWQDELFQWAPHLTVAVMTGSREQRLKALISKADVVVINHDGLRIKAVRDALVKDATITHIAVDESTAFKNRQTDNYKALDAIARPGRGVWMMTGTPVAQSPLDAWAQVKIVSPDRVPAFGLFRETVCVPSGPYGWDPRPEARDIVHRAMQPAIRYSRDQCLDLPECTISPRRTDLTDEQKVLAAKLVKEWTTSDAGTSITAVNAAARASKLMQIYQGAVIGDHGIVVDVSCTDRLTGLHDILTEVGGKAIVFCSYSAVLRKVAKSLESSYSVATIDGSVPDGQRRDIVQAFQSGADPQIIVAHPKTSSHGLTLTAASAVVWYGPPPSAELYMQGNRRIDRKGQVQRTVVYQLYASAAEKEAFKNVQGLVASQDATLRLYETAIGEATC